MSEEKTVALEALSKVLAGHAHVYDDDCGTDSGCSCGDVYLAEEEGWDGVDLEAYKAHLVTAVWGAL